MTGPVRPMTPAGHGATGPAARRPTPASCLECGYALEGLAPAGTCPECGADYDRTTPFVVGWSVHPGTLIWRRLASVLLAGFIVIVTVAAIAFLPRRSHAIFFLAAIPVIVLASRYIAPVVIRGRRRPDVLLHVGPTHLRRTVRRTGVVDRILWSDLETIRARRIGRNLHHLVAVRRDDSLPSISAVFAATRAEARLLLESARSNLARPSSTARETRHA